MNEEKLILDNLSLVYVVLKSLNLENKSDEYYDLGVIGLVKGVKNYNPKLGYKISTFLCKCIRNEILLEVKKNNYKRSIPDYAHVSLDEKLYENQELTLNDLVASDVDIEEELLNREDLLLLEEAMFDLTDKQRLVISYYFGLNGYEKLNQNEIAKKLNVSHSNIFKIKETALKKLRKIIIKKGYR